MEEKNKESVNALSKVLKGVFWGLLIVLLLIGVYTFLRYFKFFNFGV